MLSKDVVKTLTRNLHISIRSAGYHLSGNHPIDQKLCFGVRPGLPAERYTHNVTIGDAALIDSCHGSLQVTYAPGVTFDTNART